MRFRDGIKWTEYLAGARKRPNCLRFYISPDNVELRPGFADLPEPLQPFVARP